MIYKDIRDYIYFLMKGRDKSGLVALFLKFILFLASLLYILGINIIFILRRWGLLGTVRLDTKVISIGNLTLGGTGKTPLVELVAQILSEKGNKVAVLTRGYKVPYSEIEAES